MRNNFLAFLSKVQKIFWDIKNNFLEFWVVGNGGYPEADLKLRQNSKFKILFFNFCLGFESAPGSPISQYWMQYFSDTA